LKDSGYAAEVILDRFVDGAFHLLLEHHQRHVVEMDLTLTQTQALRLLRASALPTSKIAVALGISPPAVTQLADRLVRKQLIERLSHGTDRRSITVALTHKGRTIVDVFRQRRNEVFGETLSRLSDSDRSHVIGALAKITAVVGPDHSLLDAAIAPPRRPQTRRTPNHAPEASYDVDQAPVSRPTKRMRIEWD
jgi:DNA-binding MarR family transcriptional regulator